MGQGNVDVVFVKGVEVVKPNREDIRARMWQELQTLEPSEVNKINEGPESRLSQETD